MAGCKKDPPPILQDPDNKKVYWGTVEVEINGHKWHAMPAAYTTYLDSNAFVIAIDSLRSGLLKRALNIWYVPKGEQQKLRINSRPEINQYRTNASLSERDVDSFFDTHDTYEPDSLDNWVTISRFDTATREVEGSFSVTLIRDYKVTEHLPNMLRIRCSSFKTRLFR